MSKIHKPLTTSVLMALRPYKTFTFSRLEMKTQVSDSILPILFHYLARSLDSTNDLATISFDRELFSAALVELAKSTLVHIFIMYSHLFFCLPLLFILVTAEVLER